MDNAPASPSLAGPTADETALVQAFYQRILETLPVQLAVFSPDGRYEYVTPSAVDDPELRRWLVGRTDQEWAQRTGLPADVPERRREAIHAAAADGSSCTFEETYAAADGVPRSFRRYVVPVTDAHGTVQHVLGYGIDLTEQRRVEEQLRQSQKMEAVGRLAGGVAHDFNNLIMIISGFADMLHASFAPDDPRLDAVASIREASERAAGLTKQLLAFSRRTPLSVGPIDAHAIIQDTVRLLDRVLGEHVEVRVVLGPDSPWINADAGQFKQVLLNLMINARDAMPQGGRLTIATRRVHFEAAMPEPAHDDDGSYLEITVQDTGVGMTPETLSRLFEPFFTTKAPDKGTGLGLSTVYGIVTQMGGYVLAESAPNRGATFRTLMPITAPCGSDAAGAEVPAAHAVRGGRVVVVEDEDAVRTLVARLLRDQGFDVLLASSGEEALAIVSESGGDLDLLVTDVVMPQCGGRRLAEAVRDIHPSLPVLYMSGYTGDDDLLDTLGAQDGFLQKPFTMEELKRAVRQLTTAAPA